MSAAVSRARENGPAVPEREERPVCGSCARTVPATHQYRALLGGDVAYCPVHAVYVRSGETACPHFNNQAAT